MADHIQIGDISPRIQYSGDGLQTAFPYPFPVFADADLQTYVDGTLKTLATDYTVTGVGASAGGTVSFLAPPAAGVVITLRRNMAIARTSDFQESGEFRAKVINDELDILTALLQQVDEQSARALHLAPTDASNRTELPGQADRAGMFFGFDANGAPIAVAGPLDTVPVSPFMSTLLDDLDAAAARVSLGTVIGTDVLAPTGDGSGLTGIATGATDAEKANIALNAFRIAVNGGLSVQNMVDGVVDEFTDETGVDTVTSTNEVYDAVGDYYHNPGEQIITLGAGDWTGATGSFTIGSGSLVYTGPTGAIRTVNSYTGDFEFSVPVTTLVGTAAFGFFDATELATFDSANALFGASSMTVSYTQHDDGASSEPLYYGSASTGINNNPVAGTTIKFKRVGSTITVYQGAVLVHTYVQTFAGAVYFAAATDSGINFTGMTLTLGPGAAPVNMTLISNVFTALAQPTAVFGILWHEFVDVVTLNTDLKLWASIDNGVTWAQGALALEASLSGNQQILIGTADVSAQTGTSVKWKVETLNTKEQRVHGVSEQWS